jgi:hypothetical protein
MLPSTLTPTTNHPVSLINSLPCILNDFEISKREKIYFLFIAGLIEIKITLCPCNNLPSMHILFQQGGYIFFIVVYFGANFRPGGPSLYLTNTPFAATKSEGSLGKRIE